MTTTNLRRLYATIRSLSVLVSFQIMTDFISPALWVLYEPTSVISKVATLASSPTALAVVWLASALAVFPFVFMQAFIPACRHRRVIMKTANFGMIGGALVWVFMSFLSRNLDYEFAVWNFIFNAITSLAMAAIIANSLNNDQKEKQTEAEGEVLHET